MKKIFFLLILLISLTNIVHAQDNAYFDRLNLLKKELTKEGEDISSFEIEYITVFPSSFKKFVETFGYFPEKKVKNLYNKSDEHISTLTKLAKKYPKKVMNLMLGIAIDGTWDADAVSYLQHSLAGLIGSDTENFITSFSKIDKEKQKTAIRFLADVENHYYYDEYKMILKKLKQLKQDKLYHDFLLAKNERMKHKY